MACVKISSASRALRPFQGSKAACAVRPRNSTTKSTIACDALGVRPRLVGGMPGEGHVHVLEQAFAHHVQLAAHGLLGRRAVEAHGAVQLAGGDELLDRHRRSQARGAEEIVPAPMAGRAGFERLLRRLRLLRDPRQCVVLAEDGDHRLALAVTRHESRRQSRHAALHLEALGLGIVGEHLGRALLLERRLRECPHLIRQLHQLRPVALHGSHDGCLVGARLDSSRLRHGQTGQQQEGGGKHEYGSTADHRSPLFKVRDEIIAEALQGGHIGPPLHPDHESRIRRICRGGPMWPPCLERRLSAYSPAAPRMNSAMSFFSFWWSARRMYIMWPES